MIVKLRALLEQEKGRLQQLTLSQETYKQRVSALQVLQVDIEEALSIVQTVAQATQKQLEFYLSDIVSYALGLVFDEPYRFKLEFVVRRGKTECDLWLERDGELTSPMDEAGGGVVDVAAFALRLSLWSLNKNRATIIFDEPFRFVSANYRGRVAQMVKEVSERIGLQIILVSHDKELAKVADRSFRVTKHNLISRVELL